MEGISATANDYIRSSCILNCTIAILMELTGIQGHCHTCIGIHRAAVHMQYRCAIAVMNCRRSGSLTTDSGTCIHFKHSIRRTDSNSIVTCCCPAVIATKQADSTTLKINHTQRGGAFTGNIAAAHNIQLGVRRGTKGSTRMSAGDGFAVKMDTCNSFDKVVGSICSQVCIHIVMSSREFITSCIRYCRKSLPICRFLAVRTGHIFCPCAKINLVGLFIDLVQFCRVGRGSGDTDCQHAQQRQCQENENCASFHFCFLLVF